MPVEPSFNLNGPMGAQHDDAGRPVLASQQRLQAMLRGRYVLLAVLMVVGGVTGGYLGFAHRHPIYRSTGVIQILPNTPRILYQTDQNGVMPMFDQFVHTQMDLMKKDQVIDAALSSLGLRIGDPLVARQNIISNLNVVNESNSELIEITFDAGDPATAREVVSAVVTAYMNLYGNQDRDNEDRRIRELEDDADQLRKTIQDENKKIADTAGKLNPQGLQAAYNLKLEDLDTYETQLTTEQTELQTAENQAKQAALLTSVLKPEDIASQDAYMAQLLHNRNELKGKYAEHLIDFGPNYRETMRIKDDLDALETTIENYAKTWRQAHPNAMFDAAAAAAGKPPQTIEQRRAEVEALQHLRDAAAREVNQMGPEIQKIQALRDNIKSYQQHLDDDNDGIRHSQVESLAPGRISQISDGDMPGAPFKDPRRQWSVMGAVCGAGSGFLIVLAIGSLDRRLRSSIDLRVLLGDHMLMGVLPELPSNGPDQEQAALAMHCVHRVRTKLQISHKSDVGRVIAITSAEPADGKTSVTMALGLAFAASRARTLFIDCDPTGRGLTRRIQVNLRRKLGQMLVRQHVITAEQRDQALRVARDTGRPLGEVLTQSGAVAETAVQAALAAQGQTAAGLFDVAAGEPLQQCVSASGVEGLSVLPNAESGGVHTFALSPAVIRRILDQARQQYDVVLVDTGPIPGSIEATLFASAVDGVVLVASRGGRPALVTKAMGHLVSVGAKLLGGVFNRADENDVDQDSYQSKSRPDSAQASADAAGQHAASAGSGISGGEGRFGPLGWTGVLHTSGANGNGNGKRNGANKAHRSSRRHPASLGGISAEELSDAIAEAFGSAVDDDRSAPTLAQPAATPGPSPEAKDPGKDGPPAGSPARPAPAPPVGGDHPNN